MENQRVVAYVSFPPGKEVPIDKLQRFFNLYLQDYLDVEIEKIYVDVVEKGKSSGSRVAYKQLLTDKADGKFDAVLVPSCTNLSQYYVDAYQCVRALMAEPHPVSVNLMHERIWATDDSGTLALQFHMTAMEEVYILKQTASKLRKMFNAANKVKDITS